MAPLKPTWPQPSHPEIQEVIINEDEFTSKSLSRIALPPFAVFAKMTFPPCSVAPEPTYATVQMGKNKHLDLNSDLLYINHSCDPSLIFDTGNFNVLVGPKGLQPGDELTFFYPSSEWEMAQPFQCLCNTPQCRGTISGAKDMTTTQLNGYWLNGHIRELLDDAAEDPTSKALKEAVRSAEEAVEAAKMAVRAYAESKAKHEKLSGVSGHKVFGNGASRRGPTSRELSGEMGGDTISA